MSKNKRKKNAKKFQNQAPVTAAAIQHELEREKSENALEMAKRYMKENPGAEAESLLVEAYRLRINKLQQTKLVQEAKNLIETAKIKCPNHKELFDTIQHETYSFPLSRDEVESIVQRLESQSLSKATEERLTEILRRGLSNPAQIAECAALSSDSPLKKEAHVVRGAFKAVAGDFPVEERAEWLRKLSFVSRQSPLAHWCIYIRALDAFHRRDDELAQRLLDRIPKHSTLEFAKKIIQSNMNGVMKPEGLSSRPARELWKALIPESLSSLLNEAQLAIQHERIQRIREIIQKIYSPKWQLTPFIAREITRLIIRMFAREGFVDTGSVKQIREKLEMFFEDQARFIYDLILLEEMFYDGVLEVRGRTNDFFAKHGQQLNSKQSAAIWARAGRRAERLESREDGMPRFMFYRGEKKEGAYENSIAFYEKACQFHPLPQYFEPLVSLMEKEERKPKVIEEVLHRWQKSNPTDVTPLIYLFENSEKRKALTKALKYLEQAEQIDRLNPKVRNARHRLVWRMIHQHLQQQKLHLVERDLRQLDYSDLPPAKKALFDGVKRLITIMREEPDPGPGKHSPTFSDILLHHFDSQLNLKLKKRLAPLEDIETASQLEAYYNLCDALISIGDMPNMPKKWFDKFPDWITKIEPISDELLLRVSKTILNNGMPAVVIAATDRGLKQDGPRLHEFLYYRARALSKNGVFIVYIEDCLLAVYTLAKAKGDYELARLAENDVRSMRAPRSIFESTDNEAHIEELPEKQIRKIIQRERNRNVKPKKSAKSAKNLNKFEDQAISEVMGALQRMAAMDVNDFDLDDIDKPIGPDDIFGDSDEVELQPTFWDDER